MEVVLSFVMWMVTVQHALQVLAVLEYASSCYMEVTTKGRL